MESIKHKMDTMVKEKEAATEKADKLEAEAAEYQKTSAKFEKVNKIIDIQDYNRRFRKFPMCSEKLLRLRTSSTTPSPAQRIPLKSLKSPIRRYIKILNSYYFYIIIY